MTAVFKRTLKTDKGKSIVRKHAKTSNAQKIYEELLMHYNTSIKADAEAEDILHYLITARVDDGKWKGDTHSFILHWEKQVELYNDKSTHKLHESHQRTYLEQAVRGISDLAVIKTTARTLAKNTNKPITYDMYTDLLHTAAMQYDLAVGKTNPHDKRRGKRNVYNHDITESDENFFDTIQEEEQVHDVDTTIYELNYGQSAPTRLPRDSWFSLTRDDQNAWKKISEEGKASILKLLKTKVENNSNIPKPSAKTHPPQQNKIHDKRNINMSEFDKFIELYHSFCRGDRDNPETQVEHNIDNNNDDDQDQLYAMLTKNKPNDLKNQKPGNICRLLSKANSKE